MNSSQSCFLQSPEVIVVEASAGSGKTYALAKRYLRLLINPGPKLEHIPLRNILAITFTNKATVEMKERILDILKKIALNAFESKEQERELLEVLGVEKEFARKKAQFIMEEIILNYTFFQVETIDSFINALLLGCALKVDRSASFKIKRDYEQSLAFCLDLVIEQASVDPKVFEFLEEFLEHYLFVENRSGWFPKDNILDLAQSLFKLSNKYGRNFQTSKGSSKDVIAKKRSVYCQITEMSLDFPQGMNANSKRHIRSFLDKNKDIFDIASLPQVLGNSEVPMNKGKPALADFEKKWRRIYGELKELIELDAKVVYNPYVKLFHRLFDFFQKVSKKEDVLFLEELNRKARLLFGDGGITVAEVYYRMAARFRHYLIDEFQDTSVLQWHNLEMMVEEALSSGGSLFYVGDKKQAIYRFRGGEARLFDYVRNKFTPFNVKSTHLTKNWRSQQSIVEFNNSVFSKENLAKALNLSGIAGELGQESEIMAEILDIFKDAVQQHREENIYGYVKVERIAEKNQQERDEIMRPKILGLIDGLRTRFRCEDIAILTRDNSEVELVTSWLLESAVPVESEKTLNVIENPLIKEIISFLGFLHSPIDDLSFASFILGEIFSGPSGLSHRDITDFLFNLRKEDKLNNSISLYHWFRRKFPDVWMRYIEEFFKNAGFVSAYEMVTSVYQRFLVMQRFRETQAFFMKFLELIKVKEDEYTGLGEFLSCIQAAPPEDLYVNVTHSDSVRVLTIHKSKGLEFPVVIVPFLRMDISPETGGKGTSSYVAEGEDQDLRLVRVTKNHRVYSQHLQEIYANSYKEACIDELNTIYVALTRPRYELYVFIPAKSGSGNNKARFIIPQDVQELGSGRIYERKGKDSRPLIDIPPSTYRDWIEALRDEFGDAAKVKNREKILEGNVLHTALSQIGNCVNQDKENILKSALSWTQAQYPFVKDILPYEKRLKELLKKPEFRDIFEVSDGEVFCEKEVVNRFADIKRIDRLIVREKEVVIIDYKTSSENRQEYEKQIAEYAQIIKDIYPGRQIKGVLVYLDEMEVVSKIL